MSHLKAAILHTKVGIKAVNFHPIVGLKAVNFHLIAGLKAVNFHPIVGLKAVNFHSAAQPVLDCLLGSADGATDRLPLDDRSNSCRQAATACKSHLTPTAHTPKAPTHRRLQQLQKPS